MLIIAFCVFLCVYLLIYAPAWWRRRLLSNIPKLPGDKLSKDALLAVGRSLGALGPLVRLPGEHGVLVTDPSLAKRLLEHGGGAVVREMTAYERYGGFLGGSLVLLPQATPAHRTLRSALLPLFSVAATRRAHGALLECTQRLLDAISTKSAAIGSDRAIPLYRLLQNFVIDVTSTSFLSHRLGDAESRRLIALLEEWLDTPPPLPPTTMQRLWRRFGRGGPIEVDRLHRAYDVLLDKLCAKQADAFTVADNTSHPTSVYAALNACGLATDDEVRNQTAGLLFAGLNSAKELHFMLSLLAKHPKLQEEARMEVDQKLGASLPTYESFSKGLDLALALFMRHYAFAWHRALAIDHDANDAHACSRWEQCWCPPAERHAARRLALYCTALPHITRSSQTTNHSRSFLQTAHRRHGRPGASFPSPRAPRDARRAALHCTRCVCSL